MGIIQKLKKWYGCDPINTKTPSQIVASIPTVWARVPLEIFGYYYENKSTEEGVVDYKTIKSAMSWVDKLVYGRDCSIGEFYTGKPEIDSPLWYAYNLFSIMKDGSEKEKIQHATLALLMCELAHGGTRISLKLGMKSGNFGFEKYSKPIIEKLFSVGFPTPDNVMADIIDSLVKELKEEDGFPSGEEIYNDIMGNSNS